MSKISSINSATRSSGINATAASSYTPPAGGVTYKEKFNFPEIQLKERSKPNAAPEERLNFKTLLRLFTEIIQSEVDIIPTLARDHGKYIVEASFKPTTDKTKHHTIHAPLRGVNKPLIAPSILAMNNNLGYSITEYVKDIVENSTDEDILRLIVVISHEFGHYLSFARGNHDNALKIGIYLFHSKQVSPDTANFTWLVFREECTAWNYGSEVLTRGGFNLWDEFNKVKSDSLRTYFIALNLANASLEIYYKLSLLGDDFRNNCDSDFFHKVAQQKSEDK
ncbi:MAG: hypothetical protein LW807_05940 [Proteobacteria bacterium]|jgi:hypothetical protein|nr:hypothetical protein [Pseudomonadota bacterium]